MLNGDLLIPVWLYIEDTGIYLQVGVSKDGKLLGIDYQIYLNAGWSTDLSIPVSNTSCLFLYMYVFNFLRDARLQEVRKIKHQIVNI